MGFFELLRRFSRACNLLPCPRCGRGDGGGANRFCAACLAELSRIPAGPHAVSVPGWRKAGMESRGESLESLYVF